MSSRSTVSGAEFRVDLSNDPMVTTAGQHSSGFSVASAGPADRIVVVCPDCHATLSVPVSRIASRSRTFPWSVLPGTDISPGIPSNLRDDCLEVSRGPRPDGTYRETRVLKRGESTDIAALPGVIIAVDDAL
jgi:hypothetical protein